MFSDVMRLEQPIYTVAEAATVVDVPSSTMASWTKGYRRSPADGPPDIGVPMIASVPSEGRGWPTIPFIGAAEALVVAAVRHQGVPMQRAMPVLELLANELGIKHPLASRQLRNDGAAILCDFGSKLPDSRAGRTAMEFIRQRGEECTFSDAVADYLERIDYAADDLAELIRVPPFKGGEVVADPRRSSGAPIFARGGARVQDAMALFRAGESPATVSEEFGMPVEHLFELLRVTSRWAA